MPPWPDAWSDAVLPMTGEATLQAESYNELSWYGPPWYTVTWYAADWNAATRYATT